MRAKILHKNPVKFWEKQNKGQNAGNANGLFYLDTVEKPEEIRKASQNFKVMKDCHR